jgi:hypothetical protein
VPPAEEEAEMGGGNQVKAFSDLRIDDIRREVRREQLLTEARLGDSASHRFSLVRFARSWADRRRTERAAGRLETGATVPSVAELRIR